MTQQRAQQEERRKRREKAKRAKYLQSDRYAAQQKVMADRRALMREMERGL